jgi:uncharacterized YccA/Bax inhibitor family protein
MSMFQSGNPTLTEKMFDKSRTLAGDAQGTMTVRGTMNKFGFLMLMLLGAAFYTWQQIATGNYQTAQTLALVGVFGGLILFFVMMFKQNLSTYLAPIYAAFQGLFLGAISAIINDAFAEKYPGLVITAVGLTMGVAIAMFLLYNFRIIQPTQKFKSIIISATMGIAVFYLIRLVLSFFGVNMAFMEFGNTSTLGIGINLVVVVLAALNLILDFERIEQGEAMNAPKFMEWFCAMGLLVTLVWLYLELLKLLSRFSSRN